MANKTFKGYVPEVGETLTLESPDGARTIVLRCKASVPGSVFLEFMEDIKNTEDFGGMAKSVRQIIAAGLVDDDIPKFWEFADNPDNGIGLEMLSEIAGWISEQFAGQRPTSRQPA
jgi:hypothetical protein